MQVDSSPFPSPRHKNQFKVPSLKSHSSNHSPSQMPLNNPLTLQDAFAPETAVRGRRRSRSPLTSAPKHKKEDRMLEYCP